MESTATSSMMVKCFCRINVILSILCLSILVKQLKSFSVNSIDSHNIGRQHRNNVLTLPHNTLRRNKLSFSLTKLQLLSLNLNGQNKNRKKETDEEQVTETTDDAISNLIDSSGEYSDANIAAWVQNLGSKWPSTTTDEEEKAVADTATEKAKAKGQQIVASLSKIKNRKENSKDTINQNNDKTGNKNLSREIDTPSSNANSEIGSNPDFPSWVQSLSRWPSTERNSEEEGFENDEAEPATTSQVKTTTPEKTFKTRSMVVPSSKDDRNDSNSNSPFLSPLANLLSLKDILLAQGGDIPSVIMENSEVLNEIGAWDSWINTLKKSMKDVTDEAATAVTAMQADSKLKNATSTLETTLSEASVVVSPNYFTSVLDSARDFVTKGQDNFKEEAEKLAKSSGLDDSQAAERANETITYVNNLVMVADTLLRYGYVQKETKSTPATLSKKSESESISAQNQKTGTESTFNENEQLKAPLFSGVKSAKEVPSYEYGPAIRKGAEMSRLSASIYEMESTNRPKSFDAGQSIVAMGVTANVRWIVTDSIANNKDFSNHRTIRKKKEQKEPVHVRTITIRGYDASDEQVDREELITKVCSLEPEIFDSNSGLLVHSGIISLANAIYDDIKKFIDWSGPSQRIVFNGHSIGGSISILLMLLLTKERGVGYVRDKVLRVFTFGSPPVFQFANDEDVKSRVNDDLYSCDFLNLFGLPSSMVYSYVQPWDPIPRLFSECDALYPLVDDIGNDGLTLFANGPPRTLRFVVKALLEAWGDGWVKTRGVLEAGAQKYRSVGIQHVLVPEPTRYLSDRFVSTNVNVPPIEQVIRVSPKDLYPFLTTYFPMTVFELSLVPAAIRGFIHHFYPAYDDTLQFYSKKRKEKKEETKAGNDNTATVVAPQNSSPNSDTESDSLVSSPEKGKEEGWDWLYGSVKQFRTE